MCTREATSSRRGTSPTLWRRDGRRPSSANWAVSAWSCSSCPYELAMTPRCSLPSAASLPGQDRMEPPWVPGCSQWDSSFTWYYTRSAACCPTELLLTVGEGTLERLGKLVELVELVELARSVYCLGPAPSPVRPHSFSRVSTRPIGSPWRGHSDELRIPRNSFSRTFIRRGIKVSRTNQAARLRSTSLGSSISPRPPLATGSRSRTDPASPRPPVYLRTPLPAKRQGA